MIRKLIPIIIMAALFTACAADTTDTTKVGVILPLTGPLAEYGLAFQGGMQMALEDMNTEVKFIVEDGAYDAKKTIAAYQKLTQVDEVDIIISWGDVPGEAIAPLTESTQVPLLAFTYQDVTSKSDLNIRAAPQANELAEKMWGYFRAENITKVGVLKTELAFLNKMLEGLEKTKKDQEEIIVIDTFNFGDNDFRTALLKVEQAGVDAVGVFLVSGQISGYYKQAEEMDIHKVTMGTDFFESLAEVKAAQGLMTGAMYPYQETSEEFRQKYLSRFEDASQLPTAGTGYDLTKIASMLDTTSVADVKYVGVMGEYSYTETADDRYFKQPIVLKQIVGEQFVTIA